MISLGTYSWYAGDIVSSNLDGYIVEGITAF
jgi:hypothetical protein